MPRPAVSCAPRSGGVRIGCPGARCGAPVASSGRQSFEPPGSLEPSPQIAKNW